VHRGSEEIFDAALELSDDEKMALVGRLMETIPVENLSISLDDPELASELQRRIADSSGVIPWPELRAEG
jgi:putative addiction module component (TIGR02574 family)